MNLKEQLLALHLIKLLTSSFYMYKLKNTPALDDINDMNGCLIYLRVSDEKQIENFSLDNQFDYCKKYAENKGYEVLKVFREEGKSARNLKRPELQSLLNYANKNKDKITSLILYRYDRLSRDTLQALQLRKQLSELGIQVLSATEPVSNDPLGQLFQSLSFLFAEYESQTHRRRVTDGLRKRFQEGYFTGAYAPLGYKKLKDGKQTLVVPHDDYTKIQTAWKLYATGRKSTQEIADFLNDAGVRKGYKHQYSIVHKTNVQKMFRNKFYMGVLTSRNFGESEGKHIPMVNEETFNKVQFILDNKSQVALGTKHIKNSKDFYLRGYAHCSCGRKLTAAFSKSKSGKKYGYYFCLDHRKENIKSSDIHDGFEELMNNLNFKKNAIKLYTLILEIKYKRKINFIEKRIKDIKDKVLDIKQDRILLAEKNAKGIIADDIYKELDKKKENEMIAIQVASADGLLDKYELENVLKFSNTAFSNLHKLFLASDNSQRRYLLNKIFPEGLKWDNNSFSNTQIHPIFREIKEVSEASVPLSGRKVSVFEHIKYLQSLYKVYPNYKNFAFI